MGIFDIFSRTPKATAKKKLCSRQQGRLFADFKGSAQRRQRNPLGIA